ncbi:exodeoxyribonuclease V subunit gamma [Candidatus Hoaglandella endobia]|uniref:exodeoxyribonuclease V subunit gamma n=1 Tax=Candidatus Hoaglandella endobia TaxID=1778263 RepID=UPI001315ABF7|nr:exodeoxyribonuclease V subunit gamma [Candidatus Hoaglandella endobia]
MSVYHSNQLDLLKKLATSVRLGQPLRDPLQTVIILLQSNGMAQWIQMELAT